jgi:hypothetical protein
MFRILCGKNEHLILSAIVSYNVINFFFFFLVKSNLLSINITKKKEKKKKEKRERERERETQVGNFCFGNKEEEEEEDVDITPSSNIYDVFTPVCDASNSMKDTGGIDDDDEAFASILDVHR